MGEKLTAEQLRVLGAIQMFTTRSEDRHPFGPVKGREWFGEKWRPAFDACIALGLVEPITTYHLTPTGRAALDQNGGEHDG